LARIPLPHEFEPRRIGIVWSRASIRARLVNAFMEEALTATDGGNAGNAWSNCQPTSNKK